MSYNMLKNLAILKKYTLAFLAITTLLSALDSAVKTNAFNLARPRLPNDHVNQPSTVQTSSKPPEKT